jgi:TRAP-type mannitol/chloroaromatic compound transport system permease small subunit
VSEIIKKIGVMRGLIADPHADSAGHHGHDPIAEEEGL